jgi:hypothetical protein
MLIAVILRNMYCAEYYLVAWKRRRDSSTW